MNVSWRRGKMDRIGARGLECIALMRIAVTLIRRIVSEEVEADAGNVFYH